MNRHLPTETLSALLDGELGSRKLRAAEAHLSGCGDCAERFAALRGVVQGLQRVERQTPPPELAARVRLAARDAPEGALSRFRFRWLDVAAHPVLSTAAALVLAVGLSLLLVDNGAGLRLPGGGATRAPEFRVEEVFGAPLFLPQTTSQVAGRVFVLTDYGWVQQGVSGEPSARIQTRSAKGREVLANSPDLAFLLADGSRVLLRYNLETLELQTGG